jgi:glutamine synthetase type III
MTNFTVLAFFINTIKAVNDYEAFIEEQQYNNGNDHRLEQMKRHRLLSVFFIDGHN